MANDDIARDHSGFAREMRTFDVFVFNVLGYSMGVALATNAPFIGAFAPRASLALVLTFGLVVAVFNGLTYGCFAGCLPHNGGDFVYVESTFGRGAGFIANFGFTVSQMYGLALVAGWTFSMALVPALATYGLVTNDPQLVVLSDSLANSRVYFLGGTALFLIILGTTALGQRPLKYVLNAAFLIAIGSTIVMGGIMMTSTHVEFVERFNTFMASHQGGPGAYEEVIQSWVARGGDPGQPISVWESLRAVPLGFLLFLGFTYSVYLGSEVRRPAKSQSRGILFALAVGYVTFVVVMSLYIGVVGRDFNAAIGDQAVLHAHPALKSTSMVFFAGLLTESAAINLLLNVGSVLWFAILPFVIVQVCVRNVHAWGLSDVVPQRLASLTVRRAPLAATAVVLGLAWLLLGLTVFKGVALVGAVALSAACFLVTGLAAAVYPWRRPREFLLAPRLARRPIAGLPLMAVAGACSALCFAFILYSAVKYPEVSGGRDRTALIMLVVVYGFAVVYYLLRHNWLSARWKDAYGSTPSPLIWTAEVIPPITSLVKPGGMSTESATVEPKGAGSSSDKR